MLKKTSIVLFLLAFVSASPAFAQAEPVAAPKCPCMEAGQAECPCMGNEAGECPCGKECPCAKECLCAKKGKKGCGCMKETKAAAPDKTKTE